MFEFFFIYFGNEKQARNLYFRTRKVPKCIEILTC